MTTGTIIDLLDDAALDRPEAPLLRETNGTVLTVGEVAKLSAAGARWLTNEGISSDMTVAWQLPSHCSAALVMLAVSRTARVQVPVLHLYRQFEVKTALDTVGADVLIVDESTSVNAPDGIPQIRLPNDFIDVLRSMPSEPDELQHGHSAHDASWIFFTSGSSGRPKGVRHSDATLLAAAVGYVDYLGLGSQREDVGTINFPIAHVGGIFYVCCALIGAFQVLLLPRIGPGVAAELAANKVTFTGSSTAFYQLLLSAQLASGGDEPVIPSLRMLIGGGAPCPPELHYKVAKLLRVPILHGYGMTEAPAVCGSEAADSLEQRANSCGRPISAAQVRIATTGEVELHGDVVTPGYVDADQWAASTTLDGWLRTGDTGYIRQDGRLVITGRTKELIIRKGENIAPDEVENELLAHPLIDAVAVLGQPDETRGEIVCAVVQRSPSHRDVDLEELCAFLDQRGALMKQKWPERLFIVDLLPLTGLGKVAKSILAEQLSAINET